MSKISKAKSKKRKIGKTLKRTLGHKQRKLEKKPQMKLSEFFRTSPLVGIDLSRDKSPIRETLKVSLTREPASITIPPEVTMVHAENL